MSIKNVSIIYFLLVPLMFFSQDEYYSSLTIESGLKKNANAIIRLSDLSIKVLEHDKMLINNRRILTILNSSGDSKIGAYLHYDKNVSIKKLEAIIYNAVGKEIKKIKKKDFIDSSSASGSTLYSDSRVKYLDYTPIDYPYTIEYVVEYESSFTVGIPTWFPVESYYVSVESSFFKIENSSGIEMFVKTENLEPFNIDVRSRFSYSAKNIKALKPEQYSMAFNEFAPSVKAALSEFSMEGVKGCNTNWKNFGKWMNDNLISGTQTLPQEVRDEIKELTVEAKTDIEKAKIIYQYVQDKTRYISVQVGIGGWKPMLASDVERLGYGDCKGLTNYTKALLNEVGVESYYTVIYGDSDIINIDETFSSLQGNHVILCLPTDSDFIWLECTNQTTPFGYIANFTDDRDALIVTPEGGKIVHTKSYETLENKLETKALIDLNDHGGLNAIINLRSMGSQYYYHEGIQSETEKNVELYYKNYWSYINNLTIDNIEFNNNKDSIVFTEKIKINASKYASKAGDRFLLQPNLFNRIEDAPKRYSNRKLPFQVERGFIDIDEYEINFPNSLKVEAIIQPVEIITKFGEYSLSIKEDDNGKLIYKRKFKLNKGIYEKDEYKSFREFWVQIVKYDKSKVVLKTKL